MTPEEFAARHPRLFHLAEACALPGILRHGLLPACQLVSLFEIPEQDRHAITGRCRPQSVLLSHPRHGHAVITDNSPLSEAALAACLDDGLSPSDWLAMLNARVFFWTDADGLSRLLRARRNRGRPKIVLVIDTLSLARRHATRIDLCPINSGATIRRPARRGLSTFTPLERHSYADWRRLRGGQDRVREVTVSGGVLDLSDHLIRCLEVVGGEAGFDAAVAARLL